MLLSADPIGTKRRADLGFFGGLCGIEPVAGSEDRLNGRGAHHENAVNRKALPGHFEKRLSPTREVRSSCFHFTCNTRHLETFLHEDIDEAQAYLFIDSDIPGRGRRSYVRHHHCCVIQDREYFLGGNVGLSSFIGGRQPAENAALYRLSHLCRYQIRHGSSLFVERCNASSPAAGTAKLPLIIDFLQVF